MRFPFATPDLRHRRRQLIDLGLCSLTHSFANPRLIAPGPVERNNDGTERDQEQSPQCMIMMDELEPHEQHGQRRTAQEANKPANQCIREYGDRSEGYLFIAGVDEVVVSGLFLSEVTAGGSLTASGDDARAIFYAITS